MKFSIKSILLLDSIIIIYAILKILAGEATFAEWFDIICFIVFYTLIIIIRAKKK